MADQVQWRGGSRQNSDQFTGAPREVTVDTSDWILRVHDGVTPGGHKMMKVNDCLKVETADKCNPNAPSCKVTVNGELEVGGNVEIGGNIDLPTGDINLGDGDINVNGGDVTIDGDLTVNGQIFGGETRTTRLTNGPINGSGTSLDIPNNNRTMGDVIVSRNREDADGNSQRCVIRDWPTMLNQEDANIFITEALYDLDEAFCELKSKDADDIPLHNQTPAEGCGGPGCCIAGAPELLTVEDKLSWLEKALHQLEACHCNLKEASEIADGLLQKEIERVEQLIKALELQIHQLQNEVAQNTLDIALLKKEIERLDNNIDAVQFCCEGSSQPCLSENGGLEYDPDTNCLQVNWLHDPRGK